MALLHLLLPHLLYLQPHTMVLLFLLLPLCMAHLHLLHQSFQHLIILCRLLRHQIMGLHRNLFYLNCPHLLLHRNQWSH